MGSTLLTYEKFMTLLAQVEVCLNSCPLCAMSSDPNDLQVLTPTHLLIGTPLISLPEDKSVQPAMWAFSVGLHSFLVSVAMYLFLGRFTLFTELD